MGLAAHGRQSRGSRSRRSGARLAEGRRNGRCSLPSPVRIRWQRTRALSKEESGGWLNSWTPIVVLSRTGGGRQVIANDVPRGRPGRDAVEAAVRQALSGLDGRWRARIAPVDAFCVEIASPDGLLCLGFVPNPERQDRLAMARRLKDACRRPPAPSAPTRRRRAWILVTEER